MEAKEKREHARQYISSVMALQLEERAARQQIVRLIERQAPSSKLTPSYSESCFGGGDKDTTLGTLNRLAELQHEYQAIQNKCCEKQIELSRKIQRIDNPTYRALLIEKYVNEKTYTDIASDYRSLNYPNASIESIRKLLGKSLEAFYDANIPLEEKLRS